MTWTGDPGEKSMFRPGSGRLWTAWLLFSLAVLFLTFPSAILGGGQFYLRDFHPFFYPQKLFLSQSLDNGTLPLWQPQVGCGVPFFASLQPGAAYPPSVLIVLAGSFQRGLILFIGFHFLLGFVSAAILARMLVRAGPWVGCLAGSAYAFGGFLISSVSQLNNLQSAAWAPLVLATVLRLVRERRLSTLVSASLVVALQLLGGGVEVTALTLAAAVTLSLLPVGEPESRPFRMAWRGPLLVGLAMLLALGLAACQVLPTMEMAGRSLRAGGGLEAGESRAYSLHPANLQNIAAPRRLTDPGEPGYFTAFPRGRVPWLISIYQGAVVIYLALCGLLAGRRAVGMRLVLLACAAAGVLLALGDSFALTATLVRILPGAGWFRYPEKFLFLTCLSVPLLAAVGCRDLGGAAEPRCRLPRMAVELVALLVPLAALAASRWGHLGGGASYAVAPPLVLLLLAAATRMLARRKRLGTTTAALLLAVLVAVDLSSAHRPLNSTVPAGFYRTVPAAAEAILGDRESGATASRIPPRCRSTLPGCPGGPPATQSPQATPLDTHLVWRAYLSPNSAGIHGITQVRGSTGMELRHPSHRERLLTAAGVRDKLALLSLWAVDYLLMDRELSYPQELLELSGELDLPAQRLYRLRRPLPRLFAVRRGLAAQYADAEELLLETGEGIVRLVEAVRADLRTGQSSGEGVRVTAWQSQRVTAEVNVQRQGMLLAFTESHDPGWTAVVDGRRTPVQHGLGGFCLVPLPGPGLHRVELSYRPPGLLLGLAVTALALLLLLLLTVIAWKRRVDRVAGKDLDSP